jgi:hypothetical protein
MKRTSLVAASILLAFTGCTCGQGWRPNILGRLHDRIHGTNVGAPCASGACVSAPVVADAGCETCGNGVQTMGYEGYPTTTFGGEIVGSNYGGVTHSSPATVGEYIPAPRAQ